MCTVNNENQHFSKRKKNIYIFYKKERSDTWNVGGNIIIQHCSKHQIKYLFTVFHLKGIIIHFIYDVHLEDLQGKGPRLGGFISRTQKATNIPHT